MTIDEKIDLERVVVDAEYRARVLRYLNGHSPLISSRNIDLNRVIADAAYRREAVHLLNGPKAIRFHERAGETTVVSWRLLRAAPKFDGEVRAPERRKLPFPVR